MAKCRLWVYKAVNLCVLWTPIRTSDSTDEAKFKKGVFLGHPNDYDYSGGRMQRNCLTLAAPDRRPSQTEVCNGKFEKIWKI